MKILINSTHFIANLTILATSTKLKYKGFIALPQKFVVVWYNFFNHLRILYTQLWRIMLATHVLPRLLAHVLAMASTLFRSLCCLTYWLYNYRSRHHLHQFARSRLRELPKIPHCCQAEGLFSYPMWLIPLSTQLKIVGFLPFDIKYLILHIFVFSVLLYFNKFPHFWNGFGFL